MVFELIKQTFYVPKPFQAKISRIDIIAYSQTTKKGYIIDPTIRIETGSSQPEDVNQEKINIYLPTVDYFKAKYQLEDIEEPINIEKVGVRLLSAFSVPTPLSKNFHSRNIE
ncbi:hypothetical protein ANN_04219 [Periplaneta americana]|uniref:Uncharacterized protein n=1 Tax=Periplaneta americana TaxID=6978 RepID=A0ABQ8T7Z1_PERAM|nr:hypothetical protein ANN_04219 [Periplaneta americana]